MRQHRALHHDLSALFYNVPSRTLPPPNRTLPRPSVTRFAPIHDGTQNASRKKPSIDQRRRSTTTTQHHALQPSLYLISGPRHFEAQHALCGTTADGNSAHSRQRRPTDRTTAPFAQSRRGCTYQTTIEHLLYHFTITPRASPETLPERNTTPQAQHQ